MLVVIIVCVAYNILSFVKHGIWNNDTINLAIVIIVCTLITHMILEEKN